MSITFVPETALTGCSLQSISAQWFLTNSLWGSMGEQWTLQARQNKQKVNRGKCRQQKVKETVEKQD